MSALARAGHVAPLSREAGKTMKRSWKAARLRDPRSSVRGRARAGEHAGEEIVGRRQGGDCVRGELERPEDLVDLAAGEALVGGKRGGRRVDGSARRRARVDAREHPSASTAVFQKRERRLVLPVCAVGEADDSEEARSAFAG